MARIILRKNTFSIVGVIIFTQSLVRYECLVVLSNRC